MSGLDFLGRRLRQRTQKAGKIRSVTQALRYALEVVHPFRSSSYRTRLVAECRVPAEGASTRFDSSYCQG